MQESNLDLLEVRSKLQELQQAILTAHPNMPALLRDIHTKLKADAATVTLLDEEDIAILVNGLKVQTGVELASAKPKSTASKAKAPSATSRLNSILKNAGLSSEDF